MTQPGYREGDDRPLWWKVAKHLDEARLSAVNALAHGLDDPTLALALQDKLRDAQVILLEIFRVKGLLPSGMNGRAEVPLPPMGFPSMTEESASVAPAAEVLAAVEVSPAQAPVFAAEEAAAYEAAVEDPQSPTGVVVAVPGVEVPPAAPPE